MATEKEQIAAKCADAITAIAEEGVTLVGDSGVFTDTQYDKIKLEVESAIESAVAKLIREMEAFAD